MSACRASAYATVKGQRSESKVKGRSVTVSKGWACLEGSQSPRMSVPEKGGKLAHVSAHSCHLPHVGPTAVVGLVVRLDVQVAFFLFTGISICCSLLTLRMPVSRSLITLLLVSGSDAPGGQRQAE